MTYAIISALSIVALLLFASFWVPSGRAGLDQPSLESSRGNLRTYGIAFISTAAALFVWHAMTDGTLGLSLTDFMIAWGSMLVFTPGVRRTLQIAKRFAFRK
ncbi:hypothetical protein ACFPOE_21330 [Caenimonas terrae]|uniref:DUF3325 domain-containing protein n=1 Tax=Caenimonas terrae TaxID=696074 RepID=A0ABW0NIJ1_9BURK